MSKRITIHVVPRSEGWAIYKEGNIRDFSMHGTQREAISVAREVARNKQGQLIIHRKDGRIRARERYNSDPLPQKAVREVLFPLGLSEKAKRAIQAAVAIASKKSGRSSGASCRMVKAD